jgi:ABC-type antimicrobial peptide transport system permease subunit
MVEKSGKMNEIIRTQQLCKTFFIGDITVNALRGIDLTVRAGDMVAIMSSSGSGKSTLMNLLGCLDTPTSGTYYLDGVDISTLNKNDYAEIRNQAEITEMASSTTEVLTMPLGSIAAVSLLVGGIGIMNIMLVSVTERTREIGIRLSIGAREGDILSQFLTESVLLSSIGGVIGMLLSIIITIVIDSFTSLNAVISSSMMIIAFTFAAAVGIFFGFYPARKAARLNPIDALRYEQYVLRILLL